MQFAAGSGPWALVEGDFNGDGKIDLAVADFGQGHDAVSVLLGNGNGTFQPLQQYAVQAPDGLAVGDVNGDGILDLLAGNASGASLSLLLGNGNGTFRTPQSLPIGVASNGVTIVDVNGDGRQDIAAANGANSVTVLLTSGLDTASGTIAFHDVDLNDTHAVSQGAPTFAWSGGSLSDAQKVALTAAGTLSLTEHDSTHTGAGSVDWTYAITDSALDFLAQGETLTVTYDVTVTDNHAASTVQTVTLTVTGTNDAPVAVADTNSGEEDTFIAGAVAANDSDVDHGAVLTYSLTAPVPGLTLNADGSYSFDAGNAAYQHLAQDATTDVVAHYAVTDEHGASATSTLTIHLTGRNDAPVANNDALDRWQNLQASLSLRSRQWALVSGRAGGADRQSHLFAGAQCSGRLWRLPGDHHLRPGECFRPQSHSGHSA